MKRSVVTVAPKATFLECADKMISGGFRRLPVVENGSLVGIITIRDLIGTFYLKCGEAITRERYYETLRTQVVDFMTRKVVVTRPDALVESAVDLMLVMGIGCLPVVENRKVVGIVTECDMIEVAAEMAPEVPVSEIMTSDVVTCDERGTLRDIIKTMVKRRFRRVPVVSERGHLLGVVTIREALETLIKAKDWSEPEAVVDVNVKEFMLKEVYTVAPSITVREVAREMVRRKVGVALIVENGVLTGIVTERDILRSIPAVPWE